MSADRTVAVRPAGQIILSVFKFALNFKLDVMSGKVCLTIYNIEINLY